MHSICLHSTLNELRPEDVPTESNASIIYAFVRWRCSSRSSNSAFSFSRSKIRYCKRSHCRYEGICDKYVEGALVKNVDADADEITYCVYLLDCKFG